jgi:hypothetical protein
MVLVQKQTLKTNVATWNRYTLTVRRIVWDTRDTATLVYLRISNVAAVGWFIPKNYSIEGEICEVAVNLFFSLAPPLGCSFTYYTLYWCGAYHFKNTYSPITLVNISSINLVSIFRCSSSPINPVYERRVDFSDLVFSLSSHRHSYIGFVCRSRFLDSW